MKSFKFFLITALVSIMSSGCSSDEPLVSIKQNEDIVKFNLNKRTPQEAIKLVNSLSSGDNTFSRSGESKVIDKDALKVIYNTTSRSESSDTLIYAVNYADNQGFVLVSANKSTEPILAIVDEGTFNEDRPKDNEPFEMFLNQAKNYAISGKIDSTLINRPIKPEDLTMAWKTDTIENYYCTDPLIKGKWNQGWPANKYTPNSVAGCTPLAVAQAMSYVRPFNQLNLTFPEKGNKTITPLDWDAISNHTSTLFTSYENTHFYECNASDEAHEQIACLVREIGNVFGSSYKIDNIEGNATGTPLKNVHNKIQYFFPNKKNLIW